MRTVEDIQREIRELVNDSFAGKLTTRESNEHMDALRAERAAHPDYPAYLTKRREAIERDKASGAYQERQRKAREHRDAAIVRDFGNG